MDKSGEGADGMTSQPEHLAARDLAGFLDRDLSPTDRGRVVVHLDACAECRRELAEVVRVAAVARKSARRRWVPLVLTGALAASLVGVALVTHFRSSESPPITQAVRAPSLGEGRARIGIVSPEENGKTPAHDVAFTWRALPADFYRITVLTESGEPVWTLETPDTSVTLSRRISLLPGRAYFWRVDAISAGITASTGSHRFLVAP